MPFLESMLQKLWGATNLTRFSAAEEVPNDTLHIGTVLHKPGVLHNLLVHGSRQLLHTDFGFVSDSVFQ